MDFVLDARTFVKPGDQVDFFVKYVSPAENIVTGAFFSVRTSGCMCVCEAHGLSDG